MNPRLAVLLLCALLLPAAQAWSKTVLPDACGDDSVKFDVTTQKNPPAPAALEAGKARIFFLETMEKGGMAFCIGCDVVTRVGLDGAWVGANKGNSYFTLDVAPGEHHLCVDWQSVRGKLRQKLGMDSFDAVPGSVYYYRVKVKLIMTSDSYTEQALHLVQVSDDEGKYLLKTSELSTSKPKK